jgi:hypothetical protein
MEPHPVAVEIAEATMELKTAIHKAANAAVEQYKKRTGLTPNNIQISMVDARVFGDVMGHYIVGDVRISIGDY